MGDANRWWLNPGETIWSGEGGASGVFSWDDGRTWGIKVQLEDAAHECQWDHDTMGLLRHPRVSSDLMPGLSDVLVERMPRRWGDLTQEERAVLDLIASRLDTERWVMGRVLRTQLSRMPRDRWDPIVGQLVPRYLTTEPADVDKYGLTLSGVLATSTTGHFTEFYEAVLRWLHDAFQADPAMMRIRAGDVLSACGWKDDIKHVRLAYHLLNIAGWTGAGRSPADRAHFDVEVSDDVESLACCKTFAKYLDYLREGTSGRPWPTAPALVSSERQKGDAREEPPLRTLVEGSAAAGASPQPARKPKMPRVFETSFSTYTSKGSIGQGGNGFVHRVVNEDGTEFALKILSPDAANKTEKLKRFRNELAFCKKCEHPGIVKIIDEGFAAFGDLKLPFYVMPLYAGTLREAMGTEGFRHRASEHFVAILDALQAAHSANVIHRDLKPENILRDAEADRYVLADFGIAHFDEEMLATSIETRPNARMANYLYAAPEQKRPGRAVDLRADLFAIGLMINEAFTGEVLQGTGFKKVGDVDPEAAFLDGIVNKLTEQEPERRLPSAAEAIRLIEAGSASETQAEQLRAAAPPDPRYSGVELAVLDLLLEEAAKKPRVILGSTGVLQALGEFERDDVIEALELLESDYLLELYRSTGGFHVRVLAAAWFHRASAVVGVDPERDLTRILQLLREGDADGAELMEKLGCTVAGIVFALDEAESLGYVKIVKVMGDGVNGIASASITATGKRALREVGA
ncbi:MAG: serine/threonine protein kinase [Dehalococcoidia bacterium]|nr:serine/threonine protein kinase [Dehalococcoidia bacterium]